MPGPEMPGPRWTGCWGPRKTQPIRLHWSDYDYPRFMALPSSCPWGCWRLANAHISHILQVFGPKTLPFFKRWDLVQPLQLARFFLHPSFHLHILHIPKSPSEWRKPSTSTLSMRALVMAMYFFWTRSCSNRRSSGLWDAEDLLQRKQQHQEIIGSLFMKKW